MEIIALTPDVILASATPSVLAVQQATRTVPIVFVLVPDAVGTGIVASLSRPGGNATGFTSTELGMSVKWLELLLKGHYVKASAAGNAHLSAHLQLT
jgi:putative ABC transport system substrate-binding protein